jgi:hypothetical protein
MLEGTCHCGAVSWTFDGVPKSATACNCSICRRYGTLWAYGFADEDIRFSGPTRTYSWGEKKLDFHTCEICGCVAFWLPRHPGADGRRRVGINLRLADPAAVASIPVHHLDGLVSWVKVPGHGRCVADMWF